MLSGLSFQATVGASIDADVLLLRGSVNFRRCRTHTTNWNSCVPRTKRFPQRSLHSRGGLLVTRAAEDDLWSPALRHPQQLRSRATPLPWRTLRKR